MSNKLIGLVKIGYTNGNQVGYASPSDEGEGVFYSDQEDGCDIPVYMLESDVVKLHGTSAEKFLDEFISEKIAKAREKLNYD